MDYFSLKICVNLKRRNRHKESNFNDLATLKLSSSTSLKSSTHLHHHHHHLTNSSSNINSTNASFIECLEKSSISSSLLSSSASSTSKMPLREICISLPSAKPSLNETKPQLSIDSAKMKAKTLIER